MNLCETMNKYLANQMVMYIKLHNLHWYIQGHGFFTLHAKCEELYNQTAEIIDKVGERILAKGASPVGSMRQALAVTKVEELGDEAINEQRALHQLVTDVEYWIKDTKELATLAEQEDDLVSADLFVGYLGEYEKLLWMLKAYAK